MKILFIGGTGNISAACTRAALRKGFAVTLLNRGRRECPGTEKAETVPCDITDPEQVRKALKGMHFDAVADFISYTTADVKRAIALFGKLTDQYLFISSASAYQKPPLRLVVTESTPLKNPYWQYSRDKIACEEELMRAYRGEDFPVTIVRPSLTYDTVMPVAIGSWEDYTIIDRIKKGKKIIVHGDGTSLWTNTHSDDFAAAFTGLLGHRQAIGHSFQITSDEVLTWNQIYETVAAAAGTEADMVHIPSRFICRVAEKMGQPWMWGNLLGDKSVSQVFDNSKIKAFVPGFQARIGFKEGFARTLRWFEADPARMTINEENNRLMDAIIDGYGACV